MTYLIDTDVMVDFFKHKDPAKGLIARLTRLSQLTTRFSEFSRFDGCKRLIFLHAHPEDLPY